MSGGSQLLRVALLGISPLALSSALIALSNPTPAAAALPNPEVYVINVNGTARRNLTHDPARDGFPALSPGGSALAFVRRSPVPPQPGGCCTTYVEEIWVMSRDGTGQHALADGETCCDAGGPDWRPGGGLLAFNATDYSSCYPGAYKCVTWQIRTVRSDGSGLVTLLPNNARNPAWAPDGRLLAFEADVYNAEGYGVKVLDTATLETWAVASSGGVAVFFDPEWSPDGSRLAYIRNSSLNVTGARGGNRKSLGTGHQAVWAPGGRRLAFVKSHVTESGTANAVYVIGAGGSGLRRLTRGVLPSWSHDGRRIAFVRSGDLYVMRSDGSHMRRVARGASSQLGAPVWSHDGRRIYYAG
jgi:Tol biopolymer transport system component